MSSKVYYLKHPSNKSEIHHSMLKILNKPVAEDKLGNYILLKESKEYDDIYYKKMISIDGEIDKERYLNSLGFIKPRMKSYTEQEMLFEYVIFQVNSERQIMRLFKNYRWH